MFQGKLKIALVGCGQIADAHLQGIGQIPSAEVVAVCDQQPDQVRQLAARFGIAGTFTDFGQMLADVKPDVVHITTPPQSHRLLATTAVEAGAHVYVEKPFAIDAAEAEQILQSAQRAGRLVCAGHDQLFDPIWREARDLIERGDLGRIIHIDSIQGYDLAGPFGKTLASEPTHWVHQLPGGLFQNVISHALYRVTDLLPDDEPRVWATWFRSDKKTSYPSELRVMLRGAEMTAQLLFSSRIRPIERIARVYGTNRSIEVDLDAQVIRSHRPARLPGALAKIEVPFQHVREAMSSLRRNLWMLLRSDIHYFAGMNRLIESFYHSIRTGGKAPIPPSEILRVTSIMDEIFHQCRLEENQLQLVPIDPRSSLSA